MNYVSYEDFKKMDMRFGMIRYVEPVEGTDKLLRFEIDFGQQAIHCSGECDEARECEKGAKEHGVCEHACACELPPPPFNKEEYIGRDVRQVVSGIREYFPEFKELEGKYGLYILNLEPREIRGVMSHGMLMAVDGIDGNPVFLGPQGDIEPGTKIR